MTNIAILVPVCSRNKKYFSIEEIPLIKCLYSSFLETKDDNYNYSFFIGYDDDDKFYIENKNKLANKFKEFNIYKLSNCQHAPAFAWNKLAMIAYNFDTKYDYFFQIGDDVILETKGWTKRFIDKLILHDNIGVVGPCNLENYKLRINNGKPYVIENAFVSRKHLDIFKTFFHKEIKNWYCDNWITEIYKPFFCEIQKNILCKNSIIDIRYTPINVNNINSLIKESIKKFKKVKIFSFCLYGKQKKYCLGIIKNIEQINKLFSDYEIWITLGNNVPEEYINKYKLYNNVKLIYTNLTSGRLMSYRFFCIDNPLVQLMHVRDADSRLCDRDIWCIKNFNDSKYKIYTIRDHKLHHIEIMGGLCGLKKIEGLNIQEKYFSFKKENKNNIDYYHSDQHFFINKIYYPYIQNIIAYSTKENSFKNENIINIPNNLNNDFCGNVYLFDKEDNEYKKF